MNEFSAYHIIFFEKNDPNFNIILKKLFKTELIAKK